MQLIFVFFVIIAYLVTVRLYKTPLFYFQYVSVIFPLIVLLTNGILVTDTLSSIIFTIMICLVECDIYKKIFFVIVVLTTLPIPVVNYIVSVTLPLMVSVIFGIKCYKERLVHGCRVAHFVYTIQGIIAAIVLFLKDLGLDNPPIVVAENLGVPSMLLNIGLIIVGYDTFLAAPVAIKTPAIDYGNIFVGLTSKERKVLGYIGLGLSTKDIASQMFLSPRTIEGHRAHIVKKLGIKGAVEFAAYADIFTHSRKPPKNEV